MNRRRNLLSVFFLVFTLALFAQKDAKLDSLISVASKAADDTGKVKTLRKIFARVVTADIELADSIAQEELRLATHIGYAYGIAASNEDNARVCWQRGQLPEALAYLQKARDVWEKANDQRSIANVENNIGILYWNQKNFSKALECYRRSESIRIAVHDSAGLAAAYGNIGLIFREQKQYDSALYYYHKSIAIHILQKNPSGLAISYNNVATTYTDLAGYDSALAYLDKCLPIYDQIGDKFGQSGCENNRGVVLFRLGRPEEARACQLRAVSIGKEIENFETVMKAYGELGRIEYEAGNYRLACDYFEQKDSLKDKLYSESSARQVAEMDARYQTAQKQRENDQLKSDAARSAIVTRFLFGFAFLLLVIALVAYFAYRNKRRSNRVLALQKDQIEQQKKEITDSISYAKKIQNAYLPPMEVFHRLFPGGFILFQPRNVVSGDFYWFYMEHAIEGKKTNIRYLAAADCTGHGVPGALMSVICCNALNEVVVKRGISATNLILDEVRRIIETTLKSGGGGQRDGMDIALCRIDLQSGEMTFSGANNPAWIYRAASGTIEELKADKQPVGHHENETPFTIQHTRLQKSDVLYLFSDGFADQFGGPKGKKFRYRQLEETLVSIAGDAPETQKAKLEKIFADWRGDLEQVDDVLVIGFRI